MIKIKLISFEDGIVAVGFRRISALVKSAYPLTDTYIYNVGGVSTFAKNLFAGKKQSGGKAESEVFINPCFIEEISGADVIGLSGTSKFSRHIKKTISLLRSLNSKAIIAWGGVHATVFPEDAIQSADAVCIGEGEKSFPDFLKTIAAKKDPADCSGFWIRKNGTVIKNPLLPLLTGEELSRMPFQDFGFDLRHVTDKTIELMSKDVYLTQLGSKYTTMWVLGCPYLCSYCSNNKFIKNHHDYAKLRHPKAEYLIRELREILRNHDYIRYVVLADDNLLMLDKKELSEFARLYKREIGLSLYIPGFHPLSIDKEKVEILVDAGLKKLRMGIQSGSKETLTFYRRDTDLDRIMRNAEILAAFSPRIIPPFYDIILDNPAETQEDKLKTLKMLWKLKRPYLLYVYSLRVIPGTELYEYAQKHPQLGFESVEQTTLQAIRDTETGMMVYFLALCRPPAFLFHAFLKLAKTPGVNYLLFRVFQLLYMAKVFYYETKIGNYQPLTMFSPGLARLLYKLKK